MDVDMEFDENQKSAEEWVQLIVHEKSINLSDFLQAKRPGICGDEEHEKTLVEIVDVVKLFPRDFLESDQVWLLLQFFLSRIESSALAGGAVISGIRHLVLNSTNLPDGFEEPIIRLMFKEGNVQSWSQKERQYHYEILIWLMKHRMSYLKAITNDFLFYFIKAVSGERDPRCLTTVFRMFNTVCKNFQLISNFAEEMFETVACYYPIEFRPQPSQKITRNYLANLCASCLVASQSFASYCWMFIDEKLNDSEGECVGEQADDMLQLIILSCQKFPASTIHISLTEILGGLRSIALHPKDHNKISPLLIEAMTEVVITGTRAGKTKEVLESLTENLEPFVLQAEMGLTHKALVLLRCGYEWLPDAEAETVLKQVIAWIVTLTQGDSVNAAANKIDVIKESLGFLREWIGISAKRCVIGKECMAIFEPSIFAAFGVAREYVPQEALAATYECAAQFVNNYYASEELVEKIEGLIVDGLRSVPQEDLSEYLHLITAFSHKKFANFEKIYQSQKPASTWHPSKILPVLCAASCSKESWTLLSPEITTELAKNLEYLEHFYQMCLRAKSEPWLMVKFVEVLDEVITEHSEIDRENLAKYLQKITLLLPEEEHNLIMDRIFEKFEKNPQIYELALLQDSNVEHLKKLSGFERKFLFAAINRKAVNVGEKLEDVDFEGDSWLAFIKTKALLLLDTPHGIRLTRQIFDKIQTPQNFPEIEQQLQYLLNFKSPESNPILCKYQTNSPFWRQKLLFSMVPIYRDVFLAANVEARKNLAFLLAPILEFAQNLENSQIKDQFEMLMPVLLESLNGLELSPSILKAIPKFLAISGGLNGEQVDLVVQKLCDLVQGNVALTQILAAVESLELLAKRQEPRIVQPKISKVAESCDQLLSHHKRVIRQKAAAVKNLWELLVTK